ncbi:MAG: cyclodeaminase/cyclohydrolase family protein [Ignavibacteria bacterium]|nr:cyclodeaminase/cyclohydrolase family protein [Ignavibacteria bacterium]
MLTSNSLSQFLDELASSSPAPGGGSVAALAGAIGSALTSMVCNLTIGKKKYAGVQDEIQSVLAQSEKLRRDLTEMIDQDTEAFNSVMAAFGMPKNTEEEQLQRTSAIQEATQRATLVPLNVMELCERALILAKVVAEKGNKNSVSDAGVAALMLQAACAGAGLNVRINLVALKDEVFVGGTIERMKVISGRVEELAAETLALVNSAIG